VANYNMMAYDTVLTKTVFWFESGAPGTANYTEGNPGDLIHIAVRRVIPGSGTTPGQGGGEWEYPPMTLESYNPPAIDIEATDHPNPPNPGYLYPTMMTEHDGSKVESMMTLTDWNTGDMTPMAEHP